MIPTFVVCIKAKASLGAAKIFPSCRHLENKTDNSRSAAIIRVVSDCHLLSGDVEQHETLETPSFSQFLGEHLCR